MFHHYNEDVKTKILVLEFGKLLLKFKISLSQSPKDLNMSPTFHWLFSYNKYYIIQLAFVSSFKHL